MNTLGFIGGGRITRIFLQAMQNKDVALDTIMVSDPDDKTLDKLKSEFRKLKVTAGSNIEAASQDVVFLAVHPPVLKEVLPQVAHDVSQAKAVVSLAPVFTSEKISGMLNGYNKLVRMIPTAASYVNAGYNPVWFSEYIGETEKNLLQELFAVLGDCPEVEEDKLEAYAIVTAMGPTYLWPQLNELHKLALDFGLTEEEAVSGMKAMVANTMELLYDAGLSYDEVVDLIPVKPLSESEKDFRDVYRTKLSGLYNKLKGK
ncbi:NAD(P)-binding domain-containing protein [candidate division KSB1 bacterium]|nr:NAD(P)-binding domain-containing protein [candidate division KSB1 bacterium]